MVSYDLRHSFASLLIAEGRSVVEVAVQLGYAPTMSLDTYGHVLRNWPATPGVRLPSYRGGPDRCCRQVVAGPGGLRDETSQRGINPRSRRPDSNRGPVHYE